MRSLVCENRRAFLFVVKNHHNQKIRVNFLDINVWNLDILYNFVAQAETRLTDFRESRTTGVDSPLCSGI